MEAVCKVENITSTPPEQGLIPPETIQSTTTPPTLVQEANTAPQSVPGPKLVFVPAEPPKKVTLTQICTAMRDFEGKPGDANYRNNNPLNCKFYYGGYLSKYEPVTISSADFAVFKDYDTGWLYGFNMLANKIHHHPEWTIYDMIADHAPASDNNPVMEYAKTVSDICGININYCVKDIVLI